VLAWLAALLVIAWQWHLFEQQVVRDVTNFSPRHYDQAAYLVLAYHCYDLIQQHGLAEGVARSLWIPSANGPGLYVTGGVFMSIFGPSRLAGLAVNFVFFAALQIALMATLRWWTRRWSVAFFGQGLLLCALLPHYGVGGWNSFKGDVAAFCLFGMFL